MIVNNSNTTSDTSTKNNTTGELPAPEGDPAAHELTRSSMPLLMRRSLPNELERQSTNQESDISERSYFTKQEVAAVLRFVKEHPELFTPDFLEHVGVSVVTNAANQASVLSSSEFKEYLEQNPGLAIFLDIFIDRIGIVQGRRWVPDRDIREAIQMAKLHDYEEKARGKLSRIIDIALGKDKLVITALAERLESMYAETLALERGITKLKATHGQLGQQIEEESKELRKKEEEEIEALREEKLRLKAENIEIKEETSSNRIRYEQEKSRHQLELEEQKIADRKLYAQEIQVHENHIAALLAEIKDLELTAHERRSESGKELNTERYRIKEGQELRRVLQRCFLRSTLHAQKSYTISFFNENLTKDKFFPSLLAYESKYGSQERALLMTNILSDWAEETGHVMSNFDHSRNAYEKYRIEKKNNSAISCLLWLTDPSILSRDWISAFTELCNQAPCPHDSLIVNPLAQRMLSQR